MNVTTSGELEIDNILQPRITQTNKKNILVLCDRDGVINECPSGAYVRTLFDFVEIPRSIDALGELKKIGDLGIITNQSKLSDDNFEVNEDRFHNFISICNHISNSVNIATDAEWDAMIPTFYCPHHIRQGCGCRKPEPGLFFMGIGYYGGKQYSDIWVIGDHYTDILTARRSGLLNVKTCLVQTGRGSDRDTVQYFKRNKVPTITVPSLWDAAQYIRGQYL